MILSFRTDRSRQTVSSHIRLLLIRVYTVCHSVCIFWMHSLSLSPLTLTVIGAPQITLQQYLSPLSLSSAWLYGTATLSNFRIITGVFLVSKYLVILRYVCYRNFPKFSDSQVWANSVNPDQTAPRGAVWSGSTLFAIPSASFGLITLW